MADDQIAVVIELENPMINTDDNTNNENNNNNANANDDVVVTSEQNEVSVDRTNLIINYLPNGVDENRLRVSKYDIILF